MTKAERTRQYIVECAANVFNQKGYAGTSIKDIMQATGLTKGGIYGNFKSKEEIAIAAFEHAVHIVNQKIATRTHTTEDTLNKLRIVVEFYTDNIFTPPVEGGCPIQNTATESDDNQPKLREHVMRAFEDWHERMVHTIQKGQQRGEIRKNVDAEEFATIFIATLEGGILISRLVGHHRHMQRIAKRLNDMIDSELKP